MLLCLLGAVVSLCVSRQKTLAGWISFLVVLSSSLLVLIGIGELLLHGPGKPTTFLSLPALGFSLRIYVDGLSAVFLGLIAVVAANAALFSIEYMRDSARGASGTARYYCNLLLFIPGMYGLVSTTDMMWFFFIFWQLMTWSGWALIRYERTSRNARAANKFMWMMQLACGVTMVGAAMLAQGPAVNQGGETLMTYDFDAVSHNLPAMLQSNSSWVLIACTLFLIGFGIKLGMWPFGRIWLPDAHPAAPSPVSAMLSGVMIKTGVYGILRYFLWLVPADARHLFPLESWGMVIALLGVATLLTGTFEALKQDETKRLLAFSSIGQAGYILFAIGVSMTLLGSPDVSVGSLASIALLGALLHTVNHGIFKSLLFLNAGSVLHATGTQDMNQIGGLMRWMPLTGITTLIASFSIAGVPLFSGFASKWCIYVAAIQGSAAARWLPLCAMLAILTSAVTLALFIKFFGVLFLSRKSALVSRKTEHANTLEGGWKMRLPQCLLGTCCLIFGLAPMLPLAFLVAALNASRQGLGELLANSVPKSELGIAGLGALNGPFLYFPLIVAAVLALLFFCVRALSKLGGASRRAAVPWLCGYAQDADIHRYRATHFYAPLKRFMNWPGTAPGPKTKATPQDAEGKEQLA